MCGILYKYHHETSIFHRFQVNVLPQQSHLLMNPVNLLTPWKVQYTLCFSKSKKYYLEIISSRESMTVFLPSILTKQPINESTNQPITYLLTYLLTYLPTYLLAPWSRFHLEKLTDLQLVKNFPGYYGIRRFITPFTSARHPSLS